MRLALFLGLTLLQEFAGGGLYNRLVTKNKRNVAKKIRICERQAFLSDPCISTIDILTASS